MNSDATLARLLEGWLDGGLPENEEADLIRQLADDADLRRRFAEQVAMLGATRAAADASPRWLALFDMMELDDESTHSFEESTMTRIHAEAAPRKSWWKPAVLSLAAAVILSLVGLFLISRKPSGSVPNITSGNGAAAPVSSAAVAVAVACSPESKVRPGDYLDPGTISQQEGWMTLQTLNGVSVTLDAPFKAKLIDHDRIHLANGVARVHVPEGAEGFMLESPTFNVLDLGTEFATKVHADGTGTCRVFEGKADVSLLDSMGESEKTRRLQANESVLINRSQQALQTIEEKDNDYPAVKQIPRPALRLTPGYAENVLGQEPAGYWRFEEIKDGQLPNEVPGLSRMNAVGSASLADEDGGNHSGDLTHRGQPESFHIHGGTNAMFERDFTISFFSQFSWLQNFALISGMRFDRHVQGHSLILQCYASLWKIGIPGSALHSELRDPPAWDGGLRTMGEARLQPLRWHHIAMTRSRTAVTIYLDGEIVAATAADSMPLDCSEIFVGRLNGNPTQSRAESRGMVGNIDELAIFKRALSQDAIRLLARPVRGSE